MRTSFHHQSEAQPPNGPLTAATSPDTPSLSPATESGLREQNMLWLDIYLSSCGQTVGAAVTRRAGSTRRPQCPRLRGKNHSRTQAPEKKAAR